MNMKFLIFTLFLLPVFAHGQKVDYALDMVSRDSFFLVEVYTQAPTQESPRGQELVSYKLFRSMGALIDFVNTGLEQAEKEETEGKKALDQAIERKRRLAQIKALTDKKQKP